MLRPAQGHFDMRTGNESSQEKNVKVTEMLFSSMPCRLHLTDALQSDTLWHKGSYLFFHASVTPTKQAQAINSYSSDTWITCYFTTILSYFAQEEPARRYRYCVNNRFLPFSKEWLKQFPMCYDPFVKFSSGGNARSVRLTFITDTHTETFVYL